MSDRTIIAHGHIFKNAGTTLDWALERNFGDGFVDHRDGQVMRKQGSAYLGPYLEERPWIKALSSHHLCYPLPDLPDTTISSLYLLRHPIERVLSVYNFERLQKPETPGAVHAKRYDLPGYVDWRMRPDVGATIRDFQTRYLSGLVRPARKAVEDDTFELAIQRLTGDATVGIVERFDESMIIFERELADAAPGLDLAYVRQNVSAQAGRSTASKLAEIADRLGPDRYERLLDNNRYDMALYQAACRELDRRLDAMAGRDDALADFNRRREELAAAVGA